MNLFYILLIVENIMCNNIKYKLHSKYNVFNGQNRINMVEPTLNYTIIQKFNFLVKLESTISDSEKMDFIKENEILKLDSIRPNSLNMENMLKDWNYNL